MGYIAVGAFLCEIMASVVRETRDYRRQQVRKHVAFVPDMSQPHQRRSRHDEQLSSNTFPVPLHPIPFPRSTSLIRFFSKNLISKSILSDLLEELDLVVHPAISRNDAYSWRCQEGLVFQRLKFNLAIFRAKRDVTTASAATGRQLRSPLQIGRAHV